MYRQLFRFAVVIFAITLANAIPSSTLNAHPNDASNQTNNVTVETILVTTLETSSHTPLLKLEQEKNTNTLTPTINVTRPDEETLAPHNKRVNQSEQYAHRRT